MCGRGSGREGCGWGVNLGRGAVEVRHEPELGLMNPTIELRRVIYLVIGSCIGITISRRPFK